MNITVNGTARDLERTLTIDELLAAMSLRRELVAVELNRQLVRRAEFPDRRVSEGDHLEIVEFVGGG